jgi:hypothetical protein
VPLQVLRIGPACIGTIPGEAFAAIGLESRRRCPVQPAFLLACEQSETGGVHMVATTQAWLSVSGKDGAVTMADGEGQPLTQQAVPVCQAGGGCDSRFTLAKEERLNGLGNRSRENIMRRGGIYEVWGRNVKSYIPIPLLLSNRGWGVLMNTT